jgi:nicotinate phosphoribosyltransferase
VGRQIGGADYVDTHLQTSIATGDKKECQMPVYTDDKFCLFPSFDDRSVAECVAQADGYLPRQSKVALDGNNTRSALSGFNLRGPHLAAYRLATGFAVRVLNGLGAPVSIHGQDGDVKTYAPDQATRPEVKIFLPYKEGELVSGGGNPMLYMFGIYQDVANLETAILQRIGGPSTVAHNAKEMARLHPKTPLMEMGARHACGNSHSYYAYGIWVGSEAAKRAHGSIGFVGTSTAEASYFWGEKVGRGTTAHKFFNVMSDPDLADATMLQGDIVRGCKLYQQSHPDMPIVGLVDTFGREITDAIALHRAFNAEAKAGKLFVRIDTAGERYAEGLDDQKSHEVIQRHAPWMFERKLDPVEMKMLVGKGVSLAAIFHQREQMDAAGASDVKIIATSGFNVAKMRLAAEAKAPVDIFGTGSWYVDVKEEENAKDESLGYYNPVTKQMVLRTKAGREYMVKPWLAQSARHGWKLV